MNSSPSPTPHGAPAADLTPAFSVSLDQHGQRVACIPIQFRLDGLDSYTDQFVAAAWSAAQFNPVGIDSREAGEVAEYVGREIIRRWLTAQPPPLWNHQGRHAGSVMLTQHGHFDGPDQWTPNAAVSLRRCVEAMEAAGFDAMGGENPAILNEARAELAKAEGRK